MNFTREPIIETVVTAKEGCKLCIRSSKTEGQEEYLVDAVEVVSFGQALFFRCLEKPKEFLVPVSDYEVVEVKESRVVLKNASFEKTIKIGGGREAPIRRDTPEREDGEEESSEEPRFDRNKPGRRHRRRRRAMEEREDMRHRVTEGGGEAPEEAAPAPSGEPVSSAAVFTNLIPPPTTLISDSIKKYKEMIGPESPPPQEEETES